MIGKVDKSRMFITGLRTTSCNAVPFPPFITASTSLFGSPDIRDNTGEGGGECGSCAAVDDVGERDAGEREVCRGLGDSVKHISVFEVMVGPCDDDGGRRME